MSENHEIVMQANHIVKQFPASQKNIDCLRMILILQCIKAVRLKFTERVAVVTNQVHDLNDVYHGEILHHGKTSHFQKRNLGNRQNLQMVFRLHWRPFNPKTDRRYSHRAFDELQKNQTK